MQLARFFEARSVMLVVWFLAGLGGAGLCEAQVVSSRVSTTAPGTAFLVDGIEYRQVQTFLWQAGSKHTLEAVLGQTDPTATTRYSFTSWANASGTFTANSPIVTITANPTVTDYIATIGIAYRIHCHSPGRQPTPLPEGPLALADARRLARDARLVDNGRVARDSRFPLASAGPMRR